MLSTGLKKSILLVDKDDMNNNSNISTVYVCVSEEQDGYRVEMVVSSFKEAEKWKFSGDPYDARDFLTMQICDEYVLNTYEQRIYLNHKQNLEPRKLRFTLKYPNVLEISNGYNKKDFDIHDCVLFESKWEKQRIVWDGYIFVKNDKEYKKLEKMYKTQILSQNFEYWKQIAVPVERLLK